MVSPIFYDIKVLNTRGSANDEYKSTGPRSQKKDARYPEDPARNVYNGAQDPVATRAGDSGRVQIRELCSSMDKLGSENTTARPASTRRLGANSLDLGVNSIGVEERLKRHLCEDEDGK